MTGSTGGETRSDPSGWSTDTLKQYVERVIEEHDKRYEQRFISQQQSLKDALAASNMAVDKAEVIAEKWRENANEWRAAMTDRDSQYLTKEAAEIKFTALDKAIDESRNYQIRNEGRGTGLRQMYGYLIGAFGLGLMISQIIFYIVSTTKLTH